MSGRESQRGREWRWGDEMCARCPPQTTFRGENNFSADLFLSYPMGWVELGRIFRNFCTRGPTSLSLSLSLVHFHSYSVSPFFCRFVPNNGPFLVLPDSPLTSWNRLFPLHSVTTCRKRKQRRPGSAVAMLSDSSRRWLKANKCCVSTDLICVS